MDTLTHALSGALLARATASATQAHLAPGPRMAAGFFAAAFPDCDFALRLIDTLAYLNLHRGMTHSVILLPIWSLGLSLLFSAFTGGRVNWRAFYGVATLGIAIHIAGDVVTSYGTMVLSPFSNSKLAIPLVFILDPYFTAIIVIGLLASRTERRYPAVIALTALLAYLAMQVFLRDQARALGEAHAAELGILNATVQAFPQPLSPLNWMIILSSAAAHDQAFVNLMRTKDRVPGESLLGRIHSGYAPRSSAEWTRWPHAAGDEVAREAWNDPALDAFRRFAEIPALLRIEKKDGEQCVWFVDLRFTLPAAAPSFVYGACREGAAPWRLARMKGQFFLD